MSRTALITGASAGIGKALAHYHASQGGNLVLTARRKENLLALKSELETSYGITVHVIALDLGAESGPKDLYDAVTALGIRIDILINNAGFGGHGLHIDRRLEDEMAMIDLNVKSLVALTHMFAKDMVQNGGGKILQVGSTAGFLPGPQQAIYFATKAFVKSFSQAIDQELRGKGVTSTLLAPGYVETEFARSANLEGTMMVERGGKSAESVAKIGYDAMMAGKLIAINESGLAFALNWLIPVLPRRWVLSIIERTQSKTAQA